MQQTGYIQMQEQFHNLKLCLRKIFSKELDPYLHLEQIQHHHPRLYNLTRTLRKCWSYSALVFLGSIITLGTAPHLVIYPLLASLAICLSTMILEAVLMERLKLEEKHLLLNDVRPEYDEAPWQELAEFLPLIRHATTRARMQMIYEAMKNKFHDPTQRGEIEWKPLQSHLYNTWVLAACYMELNEKKHAELEEKISYLETLFQVSGKLQQLQ